ncbi:hypothetical protein B9479_003401 [Cryptococcus floricola]|uniref:TFIIS N-terminal domain-containing protein n=1 Tax=Cryptococcus floricola TaxID=2591691 RepID=A0A5D3AYL3_9TREE|nr:hypothetical protein B9479_003401 [Cryptococcus floricola]
MSAPSNPEINLTPPAASPSPQPEADPQPEQAQEQEAEAAPSPAPAAKPTDTQNAMYDAVFGGEGSDDDDSDDEGARRVRRERRDEEDEEGDVRMDEDEEEEEGGEGETYVPATATTAAKIPSFKKGRKSAEDDDQEDEEGDDDRERRKSKKKSEKRKQREVEEEDEDEVALDAETQRRVDLERRIDAIGKKPKAVRKKKKGDDEVDVVDGYHDEICARLRDRMLAAADKDEAANKVKMPGTAKLAMLDEVMNVLRNTTLWQSIVDNGVLDSVKRWLEPLPDKSLPSVGIQKAIFEVLPKMDLDTTTLKECRLGPIVLFYTKTKRVTPSINRQADALVQAWSRPIIKRPANYRSKYVETQNEVEQALGGDSRGEETGYGGGGNKGQKKVKRFDFKTALAENANKKGARLQVVQASTSDCLDIQYSVVPEPKTQHHAEEMAHVSRIQADNKKFNRFARQIKSKR